MFSVRYCDNGAAAAATISLPVPPFLSSFISLYMKENKNNHPDLGVRQSDWLLLNGEKSQLAGRRNEPHYQLEVYNKLQILLEEPSLATTTQDVYFIYFIRYMFRPMLAIFRRNTQLF
jgi:hypothetical protein